MEQIMRVIALPLNALMQWCQHMVGNDTGTIILFTLLTKVLLFPVALWVQNNGIAMVRMLPEINRLKIRHYGDKDTIAEETQKLYKREKYHPLASTVPMIVQLVLLIGVIDAVKVTLGDTVSVLTRVPSDVGGLSLIMPVAAGAAALALGVAQNHLNPLQREQGRAEQWITNGVSIAISLFLGAFVPLGVGVYWIASNLLSILQQMLLNRIIKPEKYIDGAALAQSKAELESLDRLSADVSNEDKRREKADYKRFFSVANKHLVFYSEKSGFYKYFSDVIAYLTAHSNVTIHYVTSDPKDQIFAIAERENSIKPYYIGEKRLITLMMKMDADIVVMTCPDLENFHLKRSYVRKDIEYIYMFHGVGSANLLLRKGALWHYDTLFCVGEHLVQELRKEEEVYGLKPRNLVRYGYGLIEHSMAQYEAMPKQRREKPQVLIAPSWQADNILDSVIDDLLTSLLGSTLKITVRPHPEWCKRYPQKLKALQSRYQNRLNEDFRIETDFSSNATVFSADLLITDWSTISYEYAYVTKRPVLFVDTPIKIMNPDYEKLGIVPLDISCRNEMGLSLKMEEVNRAADAVKQLLQEADTYREKILALMEKTLYHVGCSSQVGGDYILKSLVNKQQSRCEKAKE